MKFAISHSPRKGPPMVKFSGIPVYVSVSWDWLAFQMLDQRSIIGVSLLGVVLEEVNCLLGGVVVDLTSACKLHEKLPREDSFSGFIKRLKLGNAVLAPGLRMRPYL